METRVFDFTIPINRQHRILFLVLALTQFLNGGLAIDRGELILGVPMVLFGLFVLIGSLTMKESGKYVITFQDSSIQIEKGVFKNRVLPWETITGIQIALMSVEIRQQSNKRERINFSDFGYDVNQLVKPQFMSDLRAFAEAKGIAVTE